MKDSEIIDKILALMEWNKEYDFRSLYIKTSAPVNDYTVDLWFNKMLEHGLISRLQKTYYSIEEATQKNNAIKISFLGMQVKDDGWENYVKSLPNKKWNWNSLSNLVASVAASGLCILGILTYNQTERLNTKSQENQRLRQQLELLSHKVDSLSHLKPDSLKK